MLRPENVAPGMLGVSLSEMRILGKVRQSWGELSQWLNINVFFLIGRRAIVVSSFFLLQRVRAWLSQRPVPPATQQMPIELANSSHHFRSAPSWLTLLPGPPLQLNVSARSTTHKRGKSLKVKEWVAWGLGAREVTWWWVTRWWTSASSVQALHKPSNQSHQQARTRKTSRRACSPDAKDQEACKTPALL